MQVVLFYKRHIPTVSIVCNNEFGTQCPVSSKHALSTTNLVSKVSNSASGFRPFCEHIFRTVSSMLAGGSHGKLGRKKLKNLR